MEGHDHALSGAVAFAALAPVLHPSPAGLAAGVVFTAGAGLLPDLDEPGSTLSREGGFLTRALAHVVRRVAGGHRMATHSVLGVAVFASGAACAVRYDGSTGGKVALGVFLTLLLAAGMHALRLGGHHGDALAIPVAAAAVYWHLGLSLVPMCIAAGAAAHIAGDMLTRHGCPLLYPLSRHDFGLLPESLRITTGKFAEHWLVSPLLLAGLGYLTWRDVTTSALASHIHNATTGR